MKTILIIITSLFLFNFPNISTFASQKTHSDLYINNDIDRFSQCTNDKIVSFSHDRHILIILKNIDLSCLKKNNLKLAKQKINKLKTIYILDFNLKIKNSNNGNLPFEWIRIKNPLKSRAICMGSCRHSIDQIIKFNNHYYYLSHDADFNTDIDLIDKNKILFKIQNATHQANLVFNIKKQKINRLPNGNLSFQENYIVVYNNKSYYKEGGAFWFDTKIDYNQNFLEVMEYKKYCKSLNRFNDGEFKKYLITNCNP